MLLLAPLPRTRRRQPFSHPEWLYEIKYHGFGALAYCDPCGVRLISGNGNSFPSFTDLCAVSSSRFPSRNTSVLSTRSANRHAKPRWPSLCRINYVAKILRLREHWWRLYDLIQHPSY